MRFGSRRDYGRMLHLQQVLAKTNLRRQDIVVMTVRAISAGAGEYDLREDQLFADYEQELFSHVVSMAEKHGKSVELLVVPRSIRSMRWCRQPSFESVTPGDWRLGTDDIGRTRAKNRADMGNTAAPATSFSLEVIAAGRPSIYVNLGPHPPRLWPDDLDRLHDLWLRLSGEQDIGSKLHHRDVVGLALERLKHDLDTDKRGEIVAAIEKIMQKHH